MSEELIYGSTWRGLNTLTDGSHVQENSKPYGSYERAVMGTHKYILNRVSSLTFENRWSQEPLRDMEILERTQPLVKSSVERLYVTLHLVDTQLSILLLVHTIAA